MNCSDVSELAPLYLARELDPARAEDFNAHLEACSSCRLDMAQQAALDELVRTHLRAEPVDSSAVERRVARAINENRHKSSLRWMLAVAGIAAVLILTVVGYRAIAPRTSLLYTAAARDHRVEIVDRQPRKWLTDLMSISGLAVKQGLPGSLVGALAPAGYHLAQGRLCFLNGHIYLHLVYTGAPGNYSLFLRRGAENTSTPPETIAAQNVAGFAQDAISGLIVTEQPRAQAAQFATFATSVL